MVRKHIKRDYSSHRKSVLRPTNEYIKCEIFSFEHLETMCYSTYEKNISTTNATETNILSWRGYESADNTNRFSIDCNYLVSDDGEYRIDILYQNKDDNDWTGFIDIYKGTEFESRNEVIFDGETNHTKRLTAFYNLEKGERRFHLRIPYNCYFLGAIIRKIKYYWGDNIDSAGTNLMFTSADISHSSQTKARELSIKIGYDDDFECADSQSGFYIDYHDEINVYVKDDDSELKQVFGGYISSILPDSDRTTLTITGADRLVDGQNRYVMDSMYLLGGTKEETDYDNELYHDFSNYGEALKYLCDICEVTLKNNINENYLVNGEAYETGLAVTFGKNGNATNVHANNSSISDNETFITLRNNPSAQSEQSWYVYDVKDYNIEPIDITDYPNLYITYGLGDPKSDVDTTNADSGETSLDVSFNKYGVSKDGTQIMAIGRPSASGEVSKYGYKFYKAVFKRKCLMCGSPELYWGIFWAGNETSNWGKFPATGRNEGGSAEGHIFCKSCDADYSIFGKEHSVRSKGSLTTISNPTLSSKDEAYLLKSGKYGKGKSDTVATTDGVFQDITSEAFNYSYAISGSSSFAQMKTTHSGDCWAFSDLIFTRLKERGVGCRIVQYPTSLSARHRSVQYKASDGSWQDFPYRQYGWNTKYNNLLNNTSGSKSGSVISSFDGTSIDQAGTGTADNKKMSVGYDKDKVCAFAIEINYSNDKTNLLKYICNFTLSSLDGNAMGKITPYTINNVVKQGTIDISDYLHQISGDEDGHLKYYLHSIRLFAEPQTEEWYKTDNNTVDESSRKMDLYGIGFNQGTIVNPTDLSSCGKSINSQMETLVNQSGYLVKMEYAKHRKDDIINFMVDNQRTPTFYAREGNENNILSWESISYSPISNMFNNSVYVYKKRVGDKDVYRFVNSKYSNSVLKYGEQTTLQTTSERISDREAYYNARKKNDKFNGVETFSFTLKIPFAPDIDLNDLVQVTADARKLNTLKRVNSWKLSYDVGKIPKIQTTIGLDELAPDIQLQETLRELRQSAKKESTAFSTTAQPINTQNVYQWEK